MGRTLVAFLSHGKAVSIPIYNFDTHEVVGERRCVPLPLIVVEGIFVFHNPALQKLLDLKIWVDAGDDLRYDRRIARDTKERGRSLEEVRTRYATDVKPGYQKFIRPLRSEADVIFENNGRDASLKPKIIDMLLSYVERIPPAQ